MHRRHFLTLLAAGALSPRLSRARQFEVEVTPAPDQTAPSWDAIRFESFDHEGAIRTIDVRVSTWNDSATAGAAAGALSAGAGTVLPDGEFYHSEVEAWTPRIDVEGADEITGREWNTVVGVAAFTTWWAQIVVWQDRKLTVVMVSGRAARIVRRESTRLADLVLYREPMPCGPPPDPLPTIDEVPDGMELVWRADQDGTWSEDEMDEGVSRLAECSLVDEPG